MGHHLIVNSMYLTLTKKVCIQLYLTFWLFSLLLIQITYFRIKLHIGIRRVSVFHSYHVFLEKWFVFLCLNLAYLLFFGTFFHPSGWIQPQKFALGFFISEGFWRSFARTTHETRHGWWRTLHALLWHWCHFIIIIILSLKLTIISS